MKNICCIFTLLCISNAINAGQLTFSQAPAPQPNPSTSPADISWTQSGGKSTHTIEGALTYSFNAHCGASLNSDTCSPNTRFTWQPYISASINQANQSSSPTNTKAAGFGIAGAYSSSASAPFKFLPNLSAKYQDDAEKGAKSIVSSITSDINSYRYLEFGKTNDPNGFYLQLTPTIGIYSVNQLNIDKFKHKGSIYGPSTRISIVLYPGIVSTHLKFSASAQYEHDIKETGNQPQTTSRLYKASISYLFYEINSDAKWQPSISLSRSVGQDHVNGVSHATSTQVMLQLAYISK